MWDFQDYSCRGASQSHLAIFAITANLNRVHMADCLNPGAVTRSTKSRLASV